MWAQIRRQTGFTIVELLIVIVVIAILASVSIVAFNGAQARARDSQRMSDIAALDKAIKLYIVDNGRAPGFNGACNNPGDGDSGCFASEFTYQWANNGFGWPALQADLEPYLKKLPADPCGLKCMTIENQYPGSTYYDRYFTYRYNAPASFPEYLAKYDNQNPPVEIPGTRKYPSQTDYAIFAQNLESKEATYGFGFGSYNN